VGWYGRAVSGRKFHLLAGAAFAAALLFDGSSAPAGVTSSTETRFYSVGGSTQASLAAQMRANPFRGGGVAHTMPSYSLSVTTAQEGGKCRVSDVNLDVDFLVTLPKANEKAMSGGTLSAWRSFVSFANRHEQGHRSIYLQCAHNFTVKAQALTGPGCSALQARARKLLDAENAACKKRHAAFDRSESRRLGGLALFRKTAQTANR